MEYDKYYTPTIEEFHVGFEFELNNMPCIVSDNMYFGWMNIEQLHKDGEPIEYYKHTIPDSVRVKYLDQSDIESLGWTFKSTNKMRTWYTGSDNWFNNTIPTGDSGRYWSFELSHDIKYNGIIIKAGTNYGETDTFFEGTIKNKSELKKLMQQLNIK